MFNVKTEVHDIGHFALDAQKCSVREGDLMHCIMHQYKTQVLGRRV